MNKNKVSIHSINTLRSKGNNFTIANFLIKQVLYIYRYNICFFFQIILATSLFWVLFDVFFLFSFTDCKSNCSEKEGGSFLSNKVIPAIENGKCAFSMYRMLSTSVLLRRFEEPI